MHITNNNSPHRTVDHARPVATKHVAAVSKTRGRKAVIAPGSTRKSETGLRCRATYCCTFNILPIESSFRTTVRKLHHLEITRQSCMQRAACCAKVACGLEDASARKGQQIIGTLACIGPEVSGHRAYVRAPSSGTPLV